MSVNEVGEPGRGSKTLDNGLRVLSLIASVSQGVTVTEIARQVGLHRTVVYRLLQTLQERELIEVTRNGSYVIGVGTLELARGVRGTVKAAARDALRWLADETKATAHLSVLTGTEVMSIAVTEPRDAGVHVAYQAGFRHPVNQGAAGMAILIGRPAMPGERDEVSAGRDVGYVESRGELEAQAWGISAPVRAPDGTVTTSVGVIALGGLDRVPTAQLVLAAAAEIARRMPSGA